MLRLPFEVSKCTSDLRTLEPRLVFSLNNTKNKKDIRDSNLRNSFDGARLAHGNDRAWSIWNEASTIRDSPVRIAAGTRRRWGTGSTRDTLAILLKGHRQALVEGTDVGDNRAHRLRAIVEQLIFDDKRIRIKSCRDTMSSRKGAAQWIRSRLQPSVDLFFELGDLSSPLSQIKLGKAVAQKLARWWNTSLSHVVFDPSVVFCPSGLWLPGASSLSRIFTSMARSTSEHLRTPLQSLFCDLLPWPSCGDWEEEAVLFWVAKCAPGLDGWTKDLIKSLPDEPVLRLALLLQNGDDGFFPSFWSEARTLGMPKLGSRELRPLTILSVFNST